MVGGNKLLFSGSIMLYTNKGFRRFRPVPALSIIKKFPNVSLQRAIPNLRGLGLDSRQQLRRGLLSVALGVVRHPVPEILAGILQGQLRLPVELLVGARRVGSEIQNIALSARHNLVWQVTAHDLAEGIDHLENGAATSRAEVPCLETRLLLTQVVEGDQVATGKIDDVDVVTDGSSILGGVV